MRVRQRLPEIFLLAVVGGILARQLLFDPIVGLADNSDFSRIMEWFGLRFLAGASGAFKLFIERTYTWNWHLDIHYLSSEVPLVGIALLASKVSSDNGLFDIRYLGAVHASCFLLILLVWSKYSAGLRLPQRVVAYALVAFMFTDVGYAAYFNSFYCESASLLFLCATTAFALTLTVRGVGDPELRLLATGFFASAALFVTGKVQNVFLAPPLALFGYRLVVSTGAWGGRTRWFGAAGATAVLLCAALDLTAYNAFARRIIFTNRFNAVFAEILGHSDDPRADAVALGLDPALVRYAGATAESATLEVQRKATSRIGMLRIVSFYVHRPARLLSLANRAARYTFDQRPPYLGNFERAYVLRDGSAAVPVADRLPAAYLSTRFALWSTMKHAVPKNLGLLLALLLANVFAIVAKWTRFDRSAADRAITEFHSTLVVMAAIQFATVIVGEGLYEGTKHLFLFNLLGEMCLVFLVVEAVSIKTVRGGWAVAQTDRAAVS